MAYWYTGDPIIAFAKAQRARRNNDAIRGIGAQIGGVVQAATADDDNLATAPSTQGQGGRTGSLASVAGNYRATENLFQIFGRPRRKAMAKAQQEGYLEGLGIGDQIQQTQAQQAAQPGTSDGGVSTGPGQNMTAAAPQTVYGDKSPLPPDTATHAETLGQKFRTLAPGLADMFGVDYTGDVQEARRAGVRAGRTAEYAMERKNLPQLIEAAKLGYDPDHLRRMITPMLPGSFGERQFAPSASAGVMMGTPKEQWPAALTKFEQASHPPNAATTPTTTTTEEGQDFYLLDPENPDPNHPIAGPFPDTSLDAGYRAARMKYPNAPVYGGKHKTVRKTPGEPPPPGTPTPREHPPAESYTGPPMFLPPKSR